MSDNDQWTVDGAVPGDFEDYGEWVINKISNLGIVYHKHSSSRASEKHLFLADPNCRQCGAESPIGIRWRAKTHLFDKVKDND